MYAFNYHRPASIEEAKKILAANAEAKLIAGGMTLLPTMKLRLAQPSDLVDLSGIDGLDAIKDTGSAIEIGAMADLLIVDYDPVKDLALLGAQDRTVFDGRLAEIDSIRVVMKEGVMIKNTLGQ